MASPTGPCRSCRDQVNYKEKRKMPCAVPLAHSCPVTRLRREPTPAISVVMPVFNGERFLSEAIESILSQTYGNFEFIIINDGSTDRSREIILGYDDPRIVFIDPKAKVGYITALNLGLESARGEFVARQDADDVSLPTRFESQIPLMEERPEIAIVGSSYHMIAGDGSFIYTSRPPVTDVLIRWQMLFHDSFCHSSVLLRAHILRAQNLSYDPAWEAAEDYELWSRILCFGAGANIQEPLVTHRLHEKQFSEVRAGRQKSLATLIARANLQQLGFSLSTEEVEKLRRWFHEFPNPLSRNDMELCKTLLNVLEVFEKKRNTRLEEVRKRLVERALASIEAEKKWAFLASGLFSRLLLNSPSGLLGHASKRLMRRVRKRFAPGA